MKEQYLHRLTSSVYMWADNALLSEDAFVNRSTKLFYKEDPIFEGYVAYSSPYKQWVSDSSVSGANIPSGVYVDGEFIERGVSGLHIDFDNGRVLFDSDVGTGLNVSGEYAYKEMNVYIAPNLEEQIINENQNILDERFYAELSGVDPYSYALPAIFITNSTVIKEPFAFGGLDEAKVEVKSIILTDDDYILDGVISMFSEKCYRNFAVFNSPNQVLPYNEFGDLKNGSYNYLEEVETGNKNLGYIYKVKATKINANSAYADHLSRTVRVAFVDFNISYVLLPNNA